MTTPLQRIRRGAVALGIVFLISVLGFRHVGQYSWLESLWMVVITISTVGYGEHSSESAATQLMMIAVILLGVTAAAYTFGGFIQLTYEGEVERLLGKRRMKKELERLDNHVIICGFGRLGQDLARQLYHRKLSFVVIDLAADKVQAAIDCGYVACQGDATDENILNSAQLKQAKALASALPSDAENVFITLTARNLRPDIQIIAKSELESSCRKLRQAGANKIVMPHRVGAQQMERMISRPSTADLVELFAEASQLEMELDEVTVDDSSVLTSQSLAESRIKEKYNLLVVGIRNAQGDFRFNPSPNDRIDPDDTLLVIGQASNIDELRSTVSTID